MIRFIETPVFTRQIVELMTDSEYAKLQAALVFQPELGDLIPGTGGLRKVRWGEASRSRGKRGGVRIIYYWYQSGSLVYFLLGVFQDETRRPDKRPEANPSQTDRGVQMKKELFEKLVKSVRQAGKIHRGEAKPSREYVFKSQDVRAIRAKLGKSQAEFSRMIGVSVDTLQNWEQGRRQPVGPARALLVVAARAPRVVEKALSKATRRGT